MFPVWKENDSIEVDVTLFSSIIYGKGQGPARMPLNLTAPPAAVVIKVPGSFSGMTEREGLWNVGIADTQLPWPGAHKLSKPQGSAIGLLYLLTQGS